MAADKPTVIDGFASIQAARRAGAGSGKPRFRESSSRLPETPKHEDRSESVQEQAKIGRTAVPARFDIVCYECGYAFTLTGRLYKVICAKCRTTLDVENHVIDTAWPYDIRTIGSVEVKSTGSIENRRIVARIIVLEGSIQKCDISACQRLEIGEGGRIDLNAYNIEHIVIREGASFASRSKLTCRNVEISGTLKAKVDCSGTLRIRPGGLLQGDVQGAHLVVEDGGGLKGSVRVQHTASS